MCDEKIWKFLLVNRGKLTESSEGYYKLSITWLNHTLIEGGHLRMPHLSAGSGKSELKMSTTHFQTPLACFLHTSTYDPLSVTG